MTTTVIRSTAVSAGDRIVAQDRTPIEPYTVAARIAWKPDEGCMVVKTADGETVRIYDDTVTIER